jgi:nitroreductase
MSTSDPFVRQPAHPIEKLFAERWSPRSLLPDEMSSEDLLTIFEAARWAPSSYNNQPWRFLYARHGSATWDLYLKLLVEMNQGWCKNASVLVVVISNRVFDHNGKPSPTHSFDAGAAWQNLALQAWRLGYVAHGMQGFDYERAQRELEIPESFAVEAMIALGRQGLKEALPEPLQQREGPSDRRPVAESIAEGKFDPKLIHLEKR